MTTALPTNLDQLLVHLRRYGTNISEHRWAGLPTYGGDEPRNTLGVWSWDATRLIVGTCAADMRIIDREGR